MHKKPNNPDEFIGVPPGKPREDVTNYEVNMIRELHGAVKDRGLAALKLYRPLPWAVPYHESKVQQKVVFGGNRSGKSCAAFVEDARAVSGCDPFGKYPEKDGHLVIIGQNWKHIALVVYPMLFKAGAFKIIRDKETGEFRSYDPSRADDLERKRETKPAPALIPNRLIKSMSFVNKKEKYLSTVEITTGWIIHIFSSDGEIPQGFAADRIHIDEDVEREEWVSECQARLSDRKGVMDWTAMPHAKNDALTTLLDRAIELEEAHVENPTVVRFQAHFLENPHIDDEEKKNRIEDWRALGDDILKMRLSGDVGLSLAMYPTFSPWVHGMEYKDLPNGQVPRDWCRYMVVDPGSQVCGVLFAVVPPPTFGRDFVLVEHELHIQQCTSEIFGERVAAYLQDKPRCRAFIMDAHGGALTDIASGLNVKKQYSKALKTRGIESEVTFSDFIHGVDNLEVRADCLRRWLSIRPDGTTKARVLRGATNLLCKSVKRFKRKVVASEIQDAPNTRGDVHLAQCFEYLAAYDPKYHKPKDATIKRQNPVRTYLNAKRKRHKAENRRDFVNLGPASAA